MKKILKLPEDDYSLMVRLLELSGQLKTQRFSWGNRLARALGAICTIEGCLGVLVYALTADITSQERGECFTYSSSGSHICTKFFKVFFQQSQARQIIETSKSLWNIELTAHGRQIKKECDERCKKTMKYIYIMLNSLVPVVIIKAAVLNIGKSGADRVLPFPCWTPFDYHDFYYLNAFWGLLTICLEAINVSNYYSFLYITLIHISSHLRILSSDIASNKIHVKEAIKRHCEIIRLMKYMNNFHAGQMTYEISLYALQTAATGYTIMKLIKSNTQFGLLVMPGYVLFLYIFFPYCLCYGGHEITVESEKLFYSIYDSQWYDMPIEDQKSISIMLCVAAQGLDINYHRLVVFNMERYSQVLRGTYSYLTILSGMDL